MPSAPVLFLSRTLAGAGPFRGTEIGSPAKHATSGAFSTNTSGLGRPAQETCQPSEGKRLPDLRLSAEPLAPGPRPTLAPLTPIKFMSGC
jgi:hypothetical protein